MALLERIEGYSNVLSTLVIHDHMENGDCIINIKLSRMQDLVTDEIVETAHVARGDRPVGMKLTSLDGANCVNLLQ